MAFDLALDPGQQAVQDHFARFFARESPPSVVRDAEPLGFEPRLWEQFCSIGGPGIAVPEASGGGGASMADLTLVAEIAGSRLAPIPLIDHVVASRAFSPPDVVAGDAVASLALHPAVDGRWRLVPAGAIAAVVVGLDGDDLVAVRSAPPGRGPRNHADAPVADRSTAGDSDVLGDRKAFERYVDEWKVLQAAALGGLAARALEIVTAYVKERTQFGRPVGGFQAVQHGLADCVAPIEGARLLAAKAAWAMDRRDDAHLDVAHSDFEDAAALASMAFAFAADAAATVTKKAVQYHGSYGVSQEYDIQLYYRRARGWSLALGDPARQLDQLADRLWPVER